MPDQVKRAGCLLTVTHQALFSLAGSNIYNDQKLASNLVTGSHLPRMMF
jgi:hypothetical protein